jgi:hypothetical protein
VPGTFGSFELKLKNYFEGKISAEELNLNLIGTAKAAGEKITAHWITKMEEEFVVRPEHIIKLCRDVLNDKIEAQHLESIAFCIFGSDNFQTSDGTEKDDGMKDVLHEWSTPEINYPLNKQTVRKCLDELEQASNREGSNKTPPFQFLFAEPPNDQNVVYFKCLGDINQFKKYLYVEFNPYQNKNWIGAFERGPKGFDGMTQHPNKKYMVVVAGGEGYIIDPENQKLITNLGDHYSEFFSENKF